MSLLIQSALPDNSILHFVHSFWMLENNTGKDIPSTILPNGMVDLAVMNLDNTNWEKTIRGLDTIPSQIIIPIGTKMFSIGFKLLAVEYLFGDSIKDVLNDDKIISDEIWQFEAEDLNTFENFCSKAIQIINSITTSDIDNRKRKLFELIYSSKGSITVKELSENVFWSSRQINRYFNQQFGISLKAYCNILRFGSSFKPISEGILFPDQNFTDQNHFIKEIKKYSGVTPKELSKNKDNRFMDILAIKKMNTKND
ncbi:AraC-type DNA-binding protein [Flavobacterium sp. CF108]|uniref:helix-turn-helix domain-containing protein n=1 Tax=unclassified Flavobacterium TaxID=196869 RepID=UPI0008CB26AF|nr:MULTISPECIES: AraC family transcriptional regulator [unclassified Flavobacterium]SEO26574.1 AraC-type DNA-binding protein [Flavobacterium sp. fv08]SHG46383.1 AraC-type DNA-binding protein [Flavobacterium sp. CF108]